MRSIKVVLFSCCFFVVLNTFAQPLVYTTANAHSHNDYEQANPFVLAHQEQFGSIEADIHLVNGELLVGHDAKNLKSTNTLTSLYLNPLKEQIQKNGGSPYTDPLRPLQLLIDQKTEATTTLNALVRLLNQYPSIINNRLIRIVISGNRPENFASYPAFIWFDGILGTTYSSANLAKIALLSIDFTSLVKKVFPLAITTEENEKLVTLITAAHQQKKPVRFWATPDYAKAWETLIALQVDYINTDHISALADFLVQNNSSLQRMPYNRLIHSAGEVIRFGKPELENHALAVAQLSIDGKVVVEDRYGLLVVDANTKTILQRWNYTDLSKYKQCMSTYSGIRSFTDKNKTYILWTAVDKNGSKGVLIMAEWADGQLRNFTDLPIPKISEATSSIPNDIWVSNELGENFIYIVLNGNNELLKINFSTQQIIWKMPTGVAPYGITKANNQLYVSNWAGETATDPSKERAGVPWGLAYTNPKTGATASGTVSVINPTNGKQVQEIKVGLHPNAVVSSKDGKFVYVSNGSSDVISVISTKTNTVVETIGVGLLQGKNSLQGSTPNALTLSADQSILYVANGMDNAIAVVQLSKNSSSYGKGKSIVAGYIPTEAYPGGVEVVQNQLVVANIESNGANVVNASNKARSIHSQLASISIIPIPNKTTLVQYTQEAAQLSMANLLTQLAPRPGIAPVPVPERLGEPSVFKHVVYIIKENKTYDQVFGDMPKGKNDSTLCVFGAKITPNIHALAKQYGWMDDYYASGKSSAEGHQWTDAGMVSDYVEKAVRAWFRSYPHRQADALVYNQAGFIWNHALDHGKSVRVFGEACETKYNRSLKWADLYKNYQEGKAPNWTNQSTIARLLPIISPTYPDCDNISFSDQQRADIFIQEWKQYEQNNTLPNLMVISLPNDHTSGTSPDFPTPNAMVADNDLAVGRIIEMISKSKYYDSTVVFITQDDSQSGWDHISAYRTVGLTISPYSSGKLVSTNYNQVSMLRTIEQILGIPPMNIMDATARTMTDCFQLQKNSKPYIALSNNIPLNQMNKGFNVLNGKAKKYAKQSQQAAFKEVDGGDDDAMNRILWFYAKGSEKYPQIH